MDITLTQAEIEESLIKYVKDRGMDAKGMDVTVTLISGRKGNGSSAVVSITKSKTTVINTSSADELVFGENA